MNTLKRMGVQQWKLQGRIVQKPEVESEPDLASRVGGENARIENAAPEQAIVPSAGVVTNLDKVSASSEPMQPHTLGKNNLSSSDQPKPMGNVGKESELRSLTPLPAPSPTQTDEPSAELPVSNSATPPLDWQGLQAMVDSNQHCPSCGLGNTVLGSGAASAQWMFVVDAPSSREVAEQRLFTGRAGELFDAILGALGLQRNEVYASSVFKCAPTEDLSASPQCNELLHRQMELIAPKLVVTFGEFAAQAVIKANEGLETLRASDQKCIRTKITVIPTYSPIEMLNDSSLKSRVWQDLKKGLAILEH